MRENLLALAHRAGVVFAPQALGNDKGADYAVARRVEAILDEAVLSGALGAEERRLVRLSVADPDSPRCPFCGKRTGEGVHA